MKKQVFDELLTSIRQGGAVLKGKKAPARKFHPESPDVAAIRSHIGHGSCISPRAMEWI